MDLSARVLSPDYAAGHETTDAVKKSEESYLVPALFLVVFTVMVGWAAVTTEIPHEYLTSLMSGIPL